MALAAGASSVVSGPLSGELLQVVETLEVVE